MTRPQAFLHKGQVHIEPRGREGRDERAISLSPVEAVDLAAQLLCYAEMMLPPVLVDPHRAHLRALNLFVACIENPRIIEEKK